MAKIEHHHPHDLPISLNYGAFACRFADARYAMGLLEGSQRESKFQMKK